jgi:5-methylcytosine-specific restriction endonuclease McrA
MTDLQQQVLRTDLAGMPLEWVDYRQAVKLYCLAMVAYTCGSRILRIRGGINAESRCRSVLEVHSIIATHGNNQAMAKMRSGYTPPLCNRTLFQRDDHLCLYCGNRFPGSELSRDHVRPLSRGGADCWNNVVTACVRCNNHKAGRTPEDADMQLLAVPFAPTHAEYVYLQGRHVLADQMEFLQAHFPRTSPLHRRLNRH